MRPDRPITHPDRRFTQKQGAALLGVSPSTLRRWERDGVAVRLTSRYGVGYYTGAQLLELWETRWR